MFFSFNIRQPRVQRAEDHRWASPSTDKRSAVCTEQAETSLGQQDRDRAWQRHWALWPSKNVSLGWASRAYTELRRDWGKAWMKGMLNCFARLKAWLWKRLATLCEQDLFVRGCAPWSLASLLKNAWVFRVGASCACHSLSLATSIHLHVRKL